MRLRIGSAVRRARRKIPGETPRFGGRGGGNANRDPARQQDQRDSKHQKRSPPSLVVVFCGNGQNRATRASRVYLLSQQRGKHFPVCGRSGRVSNENPAPRGNVFEAGGIGGRKALDWKANRGLEWVAQALRHYPVHTVPTLARLIREFVVSGTEVSGPGSAGVFRMDGPF